MRAGKRAGKLRSEALGGWRSRMSLGKTFFSPGFPLSEVGEFAGTTGRQTAVVVSGETVPLFRGATLWRDGVAVDFVRTIARSVLLSEA